jgi:hypothetical protein
MAKPTKKPPKKSKPTKRKGELRQEEVDRAAGGCDGGAKDATYLSGLGIFK